MAIIGCTNEAKTGSVQADSKNNIEAIRNREGEDMIKHCEYLVTIIGCNDCHSPKALSPEGATIIKEKLLSGFSEKMKLPPASLNAIKPGQWDNLLPTPLLL